MEMEEIYNLMSKLIVVMKLISIVKKYYYAGEA